MTDSGVVKCPRCHSENRSDRALCYVCGRSLDDAEPAFKALPAPPVRGADRLSFRIGSLMLLIVLAGVLLGIGRVAPGLAVVPAIPSTIALVVANVASGPARSRPPTALEQVGNFLMWFLLVSGVGVASVVAFCVTCTGIAFIGSGGPGIFDESMFVVGLIGGAVAGVAVVISLARAIRRARVRDRPPSRDKPSSEREL